MKVFEISGNLENIPEYDNFLYWTYCIYHSFEALFGADTMSSISLYVDNATSGSGYTPITTPVLGKYIIIKLGIDDFSNSLLIVYQMAHELCHFVYFALRGLDKGRAKKQEESFCSAMSLCLIKEFFPNELEASIAYTNELQRECWRQGATIAKDVSYEADILAKRILTDAKIKLVEI